MKTHLFTLCAGLLISLSSLVSATACAGSFSESQLQKRETLLAETSADEKARYAAGLTEVLRATEDEREQRRAERGSRQYPGQQSDQRNPNKPHPRYGEGRNPDFPGSQGTREERQQQMQAMQQQRASQRDAWLQSLTQEERQAFDDASMSEKRAMWRNALRDGWGE